MCSNLLCMLLVLCCASLPSSAMYRFNIDDPTYWSNEEDAMYRSNEENDTYRSNEENAMYRSNGEDATYRSKKNATHRSNEEDATYRSKEENATYRSNEDATYRSNEDDLSAKRIQINTIKPSYQLTTPGKEISRKRIYGEEIVFRVVNGQKAQLGEIPYQISLRKQVRKTNIYMNFCGATIVAPDVLLSAEHCFRTSSAFDACCKHPEKVDNDRIKGVWAVAGTDISASHFHGRKDSINHGEWREIRSAHIPSDSNFPLRDIAVIFVKQPYVWTQYIQPIPYATVRHEYTGKCLVSGYGRIKGGERSKELLKAELRILTTRQCNHIHRKPMKEFVCTSDEQADTGQGDSGGPLVCKSTGDPAEANSTMGILVGIVSGSRRNTRDGSFFTRVSTYKQFIRRIRNGSAPTDLRPSLVASVLLIISWCL